MKELKNYIQEKLEIKTLSENQQKIAKWLKKHKISLSYIEFTDNDEVMLKEKRTTAGEFHFVFLPGEKELPDFIKFKRNDDWIASITVEGPSLETLKGLPLGKNNKRGQGVKIKNCFSLKDFDYEIPDDIEKLAIHIENCPELESFSGIKNSKLKRTGVLELKNLPKLKNLDFGKVKISQEYSKFVNLPNLTLNDFPVIDSDDDTTKIEFIDCKSITSLKVLKNKTDIKKIRLIKLSGCSNISELGFDLNGTTRFDGAYFDGTKINAEEVFNSISEEIREKRKLVLRGTMITWSI
jgi:hypothetical protein